MAKKVKPLAFFLLLYALFLSMFFVFGPGIYNDSEQYIEMHIHREPLYPLFLAVLWTVWPEEESWLTVMGMLQSLFAVLGIWAPAQYIGRRFRLHWWQRAVVAFLEVLPYVVTYFFSSLHLLIPNSVLSEAFCLPFFMLFMLECFKVVLERDKKIVRKASSVGLLLAFLLSLARSQMMFTVLMWLAVMGGKILLAPEKEIRGFWKPVGERHSADAGHVEKPLEEESGNSQGAGKKTGQKKGGDGENEEPSEGLGWKNRMLQLFWAAAAVVLVFSLRMLAVKSYNLVFNGHFINNTYGMVNTLTNILYASDREDGERIEDAQARDFFYYMYDLTEGRQANYKYAGKSLREKTEHIEQWHDTIKFEMIEDVFYQYYDDNVTSDYIIQNLMADETAGKIMEGILPGCFLRWCGNYLLIAHYGLIRSIAVVHPLLNWAAAFLYLSSLVLMWLVYRRDRENPAVRLMAVALLAIAANVAAVSLTIMCLSRYMVYGFSSFYVGYFLLLSACWEEYGKSGRKLLAGRIGRSAVFVTFRRKSGKQ